MKLVIEETLTGPGTKMGTISMKEILGTTTMLQIIDQPGALIIEETLQGNSKKLLIRIKRPTERSAGG